MTFLFTRIFVAIVVLISYYEYVWAHNILGAIFLMVCACTVMVATIFSKIADFEIIADTDLEKEK